mmetsp:Transcript_119038/g.337460  ORF Transcript_119038/g.337460 Transcript_119038/m.337460 type:complete len:351 (+) Transcript_119038:87-1139(+)
MPSVRDIIMNRAKEPAKFHSIERPCDATPPSPAAGGPTIVEYGAAQANGGSPANQRPPRPVPAPGSGGSGASRPAPKKAPDTRRPRAGSEPRNSQGDGPDGAGAGQGGGGPAAAKAKARSSSVPRAKMGGTPPPVERKDVGKVPAYLQKRNQEAAEAKERAARPVSPKPPAGFRKVGDAEKQSTIDVLKQRRAEVEKAQRALPFRIETPGQQKREKDLGDRAAHIDKLLGMFNKPTVFVPADTGSIADSIPPLAPACGGGDSPSSKARGNVGDGMREAMQRPNSRGSGNSNQQSRANRAAALSAERVQAGHGAPWDHAPRSNDGASAHSGVSSGVRIAAPPGGKSSLQLF